MQGHRVQGHRVTVVAFQSRNLRIDQHGALLEISRQCSAITAIHLVVVKPRSLSESK